MGVTVRAGFEIAENGIDPFELGDLFQFAYGHVGRIMAPAGGDKEHLVSRSSLDLAATAFTVKTGIIHLDFQHFSRSAIICMSFVASQPSGGVTHCQLPLQGQGRQPGSGLVDQVDHQELNRQGQLGVLKYRSSNQ